LHEEGSVYGDDISRRDAGVGVLHVALVLLVLTPELAKQALDEGGCLETQLVLPTACDLEDIVISLVEIRLVFLVGFRSKEDLVMVSFHSLVIEDESEIGQLEERRHL
jgi:hypothetical protein